MNCESRTIFIGDVHGCYDELIELFQVFEFKQATDRVIFLGDLVHKGPKSAEVLEYVFKNKFEVLMGNHDHWFLQTALKKQPEYPGFSEIINQVSISNSDLLGWMVAWPFFISEKEFLAVHGGLDPDAQCLHKVDGDVCMNLRFWDLNNAQMDDHIYRNELPKGIKPWYQVFNFENLVIPRILFGHWAQKDIVISEDQRILGLDTGCCYGGKLTAYWLEQNQFFQVKSKQPKQFDY